MPKNNLTTRNAAFGLRQSPASLDDTARTVDFVLATEGRVPVWDWERGMIDEILLMSGCSFPEQVPLLDAHSRCSIEDQLGSLRGLRVEGESLLATAHFSSTAGDAFRKVAEGHLTDISVGYSVDESYWIPEGETGFVGESGRSFAGPVRVVSKWTVREGSLTPIGADDAAKARSQQCNPEATMPNTLPSQTTPEPVATPPIQKNRSASEPLPVTAPDAVQEPVVPDDAARAVAEAMGADKLIFLTDTDGILVDSHNQSTRIARMDVASPLMETSINGARGVLINITGSEDMGLEDVETAANLVQEAAHPDANIIFGASFDPSLDDEIRVSVIATGFDEPGKAQAEQAAAAPAQAPAAGLYTAAATAAKAAAPAAAPAAPATPAPAAAPAADAAAPAEEDPFDSIFKIFNSK